MGEVGQRPQDRGSHTGTSGPPPHHPPCPRSSPVGALRAGEPPLAYSLGAARRQPRSLAMVLRHVRAYVDGGRVRAGAGAGRPRGRLHRAPGLQRLRAGRRDRHDRHQARLVGRDAAAGRDRLPGQHRGVPSPVSLAAHPVRGGGGGAAPVRRQRCRRAGGGLVRPGARVPARTGLGGPAGQFLVPVPDPGARRGDAPVPGGGGRARRGQRGVRDPGPPGLSPPALAGRRRAVRGVRFRAGIPGRAARPGVLGTGAGDQHLQPDGLGHDAALVAGGGRHGGVVRQRRARGLAGRRQVPAGGGDRRGGGFRARPGPGRLLAAADPDPRVRAGSGCRRCSV